VGEALYSTARQRLAETLPDLLAEPLAGLESELADALLAVTPPQQVAEIGEYDWSDIESFAFGLRGYENCMTAIRKLVLHTWEGGTGSLAQAQRQLLEEKVIQRNPWPQLCRHHGFSGRKEAVTALREAVGELLHQYRRE
jgi:tRNA(Met) cytidine acetyltransferase